MKIHTLAFALTLTLALPVLAQDAPPMTPEQQAMMDAYVAAGTPGAPHAALAAAVGDYDLVIRSWESAEGEPSVETGTATRSMILGGRVMVENMEGTMYGQQFHGHGMVGFDNVTGKWWQTWNDNMSTGVMASEGDCDAQANCTFHGSWNDPLTKKKADARFTTRWTSATTEVFEMHGAGPDGQEYKMMEITYTRR